MKKKVIAFLIVLIVVCLIICLVIALNQKKENTDVSNAQYKVSFLDFDNNAIDEKTVTAGNNVVPPKAPTKDGYIFKQWDKSLLNINSDMEVKAIYDEVKEPTVSVENVIVSNEAETIKVDVNLLQNPGISSMLYDLYYDDALILKNIELNAEFGENITTPEPYTNPQTISMVSPFNDTKYSGNMATLTFEIANMQAIDDYAVYNIDIRLNQDNVFDVDYKDVNFVTSNGSVTVIK